LSSCFRLFFIPFLGEKQPISRLNFSGDSSALWERELVRCCREVQKLVCGMADIEDECRC
ncbi:hypothetical protein, partial [Serratia fonticola]|uniref:hypothetical protein n=1 Tax=Serratia fonticola TaxID=47917 RepID=UPI003AB04EFD